MTRSRASAKAAGSTFERLVADYLADALADDRIDRRVKRGNQDRGDIGGIRTPLGDRVVVECKDVAKLSLGTWMTETEAEKGNDDAPVGVIVHKRRGYGAANMGGTYVTMTLRDLTILLGSTETTGDNR